MGGVPEGGLSLSLPCISPLFWNSRGLPVGIRKPGLGAFSRLQRAQQLFPVSASGDPLEPRSKPAYRPGCI